MKKALLLTTMLFLFSGCRSQQLVPENQKIAEGQELYCLSDSLEEAQRIAQDYGIELVSFGDGVAVFHTEDDPEEVIKLGKNKGYTELSLNIVILLSS